MKMKFPHRRSAFTLVEMLIVISIIGILVALLIPTIAGAIRTGKRAAIALEMDQLAQAMESYKAKNGDYPPDFTNQAAVVAHMKKAYPRSSTTAVVQWLTNASGNLSPDPRDLDPAEALVFWLAMTKNNPRDPLSGTGETVPYYDFDQARLAMTDLDGDGWPEYAPKQAPGAPYVYFDGRIQSDTGANLTCAYAWALYPSPYGRTTSTPPAALVRAAAKHPLVFDNIRDNSVRPYRSSTLAATTETWPNEVNLTQWLNIGKFQIVCAGLDAEFGADLTTGNSNDPVLFKQFPEPNYVVTPEDADNLASFSEGRTLGDSVP